MVTKLLLSTKLYNMGLYTKDWTQTGLEVRGGGVVGAGDTGLGCTKYTSIVIVIYKWLLHCRRRDVLYKGVES